MSKIIMLGTILTGALLSFSSFASWKTDSLCENVNMFAKYTEKSFIYNSVHEENITFSVPRPASQFNFISSGEVDSVVINGKRISMRVHSLEGRDTANYSMYHKDIPYSLRIKQVNYILNELRTKKELVISHRWGEHIVSAMGFSQAWKEYKDCQL